MEFWNDYEGKTIAAFPLKKLIRPEGRSAFFTTVSLDSKPAVLRLTESLNDQEELLARWRQVTEAAQPNLITINNFGRTTFDGVPLTYALMEAPDASLADILLERPLTPAETLQVAIAVTTALRALHDIALIHEHIEPASVHATGETIKLRSDCVRECVPDPEFNPEPLCLERRQRDIHDLGVLLLRCLTLEKTLTPATRLPAPFAQVIPHAIDGTWTLAQIADALSPPVAKPLVPSTVLAAAQTAPAPEPVAATERPAAQLSLDEAPIQQQLPLRDHSDDALYPSPDFAFPAWVSNPRIWIAAAVILLLVFIVAHIHSAPAAERQIAANPAPVAAPAVVVAAKATPDVAPAANPATDTQPGWRVIVYTYTKEAQAFAKAAAIQASHPDLRAEVFARHRHAPFLVSLGGPMSHEQADAMLERARRAGLPRDSFVRLYSNS